jgi:hypothetical protein
MLEQHEKCQDKKAPAYFRSRLVEKSFNKIDTSRFLNRRVASL